MTAAIRVEGLGKRYQVVQGGQRARYRRPNETSRRVADSGFPSRLP